jgi:hypothetical protein
MASHFAKCKLQNDGTYKVLRVNYGKEGQDENELTSREKEEGVIWKKTSYGTRAGLHYSKNEFNEWVVDRDAENNYDRSKSFRKNYAGIGFTYDPTRDAFIPPKPYPSWTLIESSCTWQSPEGPKPLETEEQMIANQRYQWNETDQSWDLV